MPQRHTRQYGIFHITICTRNRIPWCIRKGVPEIIIDNLVMTRNLQRAKLYAFAILPDHVHVIVEPSEKGLSKFMHSFKRNTARDVRVFIRSRGSTSPASSYIVAPRLRTAVATDVGDGHAGLWQSGYHDERIRDGRQFSKAMHYVQGNAMRHGLVQDVIDWPWSSLHYSDLLDLSETWID